LNSKLNKLFLLVFVLSCCAGLRAQITGELRGTVVDPSGAAISSAKVSLTSVETGQVREQTTNTQGEFAFNLLPVGTYEVRAEASGFVVAITRAPVKTGETARVDLKLEVGQVTQSVDVSGAVQQLDTEDAQIQHSVSGQTVQEIPVSRNPNLFALLSPGVAPVSANNPYLGSGSFNSNGGRGRGNNITVDGITATDVSVTGTGGPLGPLNFASIKEVQVITNNFNAEYGRNSSSQVIYITKGGTNDLHGELYEYFENDKLNARSFFDSTGKPSTLRNNIYGFEVGGPVFIPKLYNGRNRVFWHVDYEGVKTRGAGQAQIAAVPTPAQLASVTDPTSLALIKQYNLPSSPTGTIQATAPNLTNSYQVSYRMDVAVTRNDTLWGRYGVFDSQASSSGLTFINSQLPGFGAGSTNHPREALLSETHLFGPSAVNEFRFGFGQSKPNFPIQTPYAFGPQITFSDGSVTSIGVSNILPQGREQRTYQYTDNFSFTHGTHNFKVGAEYYNLDADSFFDSNIRSSLTFNTFASFAAGTPATYTQNFGNSVRNNVVHNAFAFAQDDWKVTRNLTLNLGVRYEWAGGPTEANGKISNLDLDDKASFGAAGAGPLGLLVTGKPSFNSNNNWAPRFGFAWSPTSDGKTVVRGGYGIAYDFIYLNPITNQRFLPPFIYSASLSGASSFTGGNSYANLVAGTATIQQQTSAAVGTLSPTVLNFGTISPAIAQNLKNPQVQQWNLGLEREFAGLVWKATYVGTKGTYLTRTRPINLIANPVTPATSLADEQARLSQFTTAFAGLNGGSTSHSNRYDPRYNTVGYLESSANSNYNALQIEVLKRASKGLYFSLAYSYAKSIDDNSDALGVLVNDTSSQQDPLDNRNNRGPSQFDLRHTLSIGHSYQLPFFQSGSSNRFVKSVLGGWAFAGISTYRSGFPVNIFSGPRFGISDSIAPLGGTAVDRPNVAGPITNFNPQAAGSVGNPASLGLTTVNGVSESAYAASLGLSQPLLGNFGSLGRNVLRLDGQTNFDWDVYKNFVVREKVNFQIRGEFYNAFNMVAFQNMASSTITSKNFGVYNTLSQNPRLIQLALRMIF
jgi:outer membrane receptor protein involved in Fe transport